MENSNIPEIPKNKFHIIANRLCIVLHFFVFLYIIWQWDSLPAIIPTHFNAAGEVDGYGSKWTLWLIPLFMVITYMIMHLVEKHPGSWNVGVTITRWNRDRVYLAAKDMLIATKLSLTLVFSWISVIILKPVGIGISLPVILLIVFVPMTVCLIRLVKASKEI